MSETPTQPPTAQALARARARGDLPFSVDWTSAAVLAAFSVAALYGMPAAWSAGSGLARTAWAGSPPSGAEWSAVLRPLALSLAAVSAAAWLAIGAQRAGTLRLLQSAPSGRASGRTARRPLWTAASGWLKALLLLAALGSSLRGSLPGLLDAQQREPAALLALFGRVALSLGSRAIAVLLLLGAGDLALQQLARLRRLRMTRREALEEQREQSGDPRLLTERRARAAAGRAAAASWAELSSASLVITGRGRALALRYAPEQTAAPILWLKAEGALAVQLLARAYAADLPLASDDGLTEDLFRLEPGQPIPPAAHAPVAALLVAATHQVSRRGAV